jgi:hypothetical protein
LTLDRNHVILGSTKKEKEALMFEKFAIPDLNQKKHSGKGFKLPLPCMVEGTTGSGDKFREKTTLSYISYQGASFWLTHTVEVGSELKLIIGLPPNLSADKNLKLIIKGKVVFVEVTNGKESRERISLHFDNKYIIKEED